MSNKKELSVLARCSLLNLVQEEVKAYNYELKITKASPKIKSPRTMGFKKDLLTKAISLKSLEGLDDNLTCDRTILEDSFNTSPQEQSFRSYKYLKDLSERVRNFYFTRDKKFKALSTVKLPNVRNKIEKVEVNNFKRNSVCEKNKNLSFLKLIPCLNDKSFKIDLIQCERK
jgi:hypothetical protein